MAILVAATTVIGHFSVAATTVIGHFKRKKIRFNRMLPTLSKIYEQLIERTSMALCVKKKYLELGGTFGGWGGRIEATKG